MTTGPDNQRLVLNVPRDFHRELKIAAAVRGVDMRDLVIACVSECIKQETATDALKTGRPNSQPEAGA